MIGTAGEIEAVKAACASYLAKFAFKRGAVGEGELDSTNAKESRFISLKAFFGGRVNQSESQALARHLRREILGF